MLKYRCSDINHCVEKESFIMVTLMILFMTFFVAIPTIVFVEFPLLALACLPFLLLAVFGPLFGIPV